jgi:hypothetical protein
MNAVSTKVLLQVFSSRVPIFPVYFQFLMPRHVLSGRYIRCGHTKYLCNLLLGILHEVTRANHTVLYEVPTIKHARVALEKIWMGKWAHWRKK